MNRVVDMIKIVYIIPLILVLAGSIGITGITHAQLWYNSETDSANECPDDYSGP